MTSGGPALFRRSAVEKSNTELLNSLRENLDAARTASTDPADSTTWTSPDPSDPEQLYIPTPNITEYTLAEDRDEYDITGTPPPLLLSPAFPDPE